MQWHKWILGPKKWRCGRELWIYRQNPEKEILWVGLNSYHKAEVHALIPTLSNHPSFTAMNQGVCLSAHGMFVKIVAEWELGMHRESQSRYIMYWVGAAPAKLVCMWRGPNPTTKRSHLIQLCTSTFSPVFHSEKCLKIILNRLSRAEF